MLHSLRARLFAGVIVVDLLLGAVFTFSGYRAMSDWVAGSVQADARTSHKLLVSAVAPLLAEINLGALQDLVQQATSSGSLGYVLVRDPLSGRVLAGAGKAPRVAVARQRIDVDGAPAATAQDGTFHFAAPVLLGDQTYGQLEFGLSSAVSAQAVRRLVGRALTISAAGLAVAGALLFLLTGILTRGLSRLAEAARQVGAGGEAPPLPVDGRNEVAQVSAAFNDMTRRLSSRMAALAHSEAVQRGVAESLAEAVLLQRGDGRLASFNPAAVSMLGLSPAQLDGEEALPAGWELLDSEGAEWAPPWPPRPPGDAAGCPAQARQHLELRRPGTGSRWLSVNRVQLPSAADDGLVVWSIADISEFIEAQSQLQRANRELEQRVEQRTAELALARDMAEAASHAKSEFLSRMSHELRSPLNAILGFAQLIPVYSGASAKVTTAARHIEKGGWHLLALIDDILDLARIEAGKIRVELQDLALAQVAGECAKLVQLDAERLGVTLQLSVPPGLTVVADRVRLAEVLNNLLSNGVKYSRPGGWVRLRGWRRADGRVGVSVQDSGIGLSEEQLSRLFQPFERLGAEHGATRGTGIGLVITERLVGLMGGRLLVRSCPGEGSTFEFDLAPASTPQATRATRLPRPLPGLPATQEVPPGAARQRVLYIEDDAANAAVMQDLLAHRPAVELEIACTGAEGLSRARAAPPALLMIDIRLPDADGVALCREARTDPRLQALPILAVTADAMPADLERCRAAGFDACLTKPLQLAAVLAAIDRALEPNAVSPGG